jgi:hypothetical protein
MSKYSDYLKELPSRELEIDIDLVGSITKFPFKGRFKADIPDIKGKILIDQKRAALNGGIPHKELSPDIAMTNMMLAYLSVALSDTPLWWKEDLDYGNSLLDSNLLLELYSKIRDFEDTWKASVWKDEGESEQDG